MTKRATAKPSKLGPGEYLPDPTELIQRAEDLPQPKLLKQSRNYPHRSCPRCGRAAYRDRVFHRQLHDTCTCGKCRCIGDLVSGRPHEIDLVYSQHYCCACRKYFSVDTSDLAPPGGRYTHRVMALAVRSVVEDGLAYRNASWRLWRDHRVFVPFATRFARTGWKPGGKRATERFETDYVAWALADFSGYLTADELYDGPFCVLSLVDNRTFQRLDYQVLDHDATQADVLAFFQRFQARLIARQLRVQAITTDGSALYPPAIAAVFGAIPHQVCQFHVLADLSAAVRHAVAHGRKSLAAHQPKRRRGRPAQHELPQVRQAQRLQAKIADLFTHRYLFVQRQLSPSERATLQRITRGLPHLRSLRATPAPSLTCVAAGKRQAVRCVSWTKSIACLHLGRRHRCSTAAAAPKPPWPSWPACAAGCSALRKSARPCGPSSRPMSRRR